MTFEEQAKQYNRELKEALTEIFAELNQGQTKKLLKNATIAAMVKKYGVEVK